jgi:hypothetical protein
MTVVRTNKIQMFSFATRQDLHAKWIRYREKEMLRAAPCYEIGGVGGRSKLHFWGGILNLLRG